MKVIVFDTETTGLPKTKIINPDTFDQWPHIVQFSYVIYDYSINAIVETQNYIVKVPDSVIIPEESMKLHGISNELSKNSGTELRIVLKEFFCNMKECDFIIGHNVDFDIKMVRVELLRIIYNAAITRKELYQFKNNLYFLNNFKNIKCTMKKGVNLCAIQAIDKEGKPYLKYPKLIELHQKLFDSEPKNLHNSFNDILVTLRCFVMMEFSMDILDTCLSFKLISHEIGLY